MARCAASREAPGSQSPDAVRGRTVTRVFCRADRSGGELHVRDLDSGSDTVIGAAAESRVSCDLARRVSGSPSAHLCRDRQFSVRCDCSRVPLGDAPGPRRLWRPPATMARRPDAADRNIRHRAQHVARARHRRRQPASIAVVEDPPLSNPRVSPDRRWLAFDAATPGGLPQSRSRAWTAPRWGNPNGSPSARRPVIRSGRATDVCSTTCRHASVDIATVWRRGGLIQPAAALKASLSSS